MAKCTALAGSALKELTDISHSFLMPIPTPQTTIEAKGFMTRVGVGVGEYGRRSKNFTMIFVRFGAF